MAEGSETFMGLAVPLFGESEITQQTAASDIVTLTGAASQTGDFIVCQNSTGAEVFVVDVSGIVTLEVSATTQAAGLDIVVTSTGALAALGTTETYVSAVVVSPSSKAIMNCAFVYMGGDTATVNTAVTLLGCDGGNSLPSYFLSVAGSGSAMFVGAHSGDHGFVDAAMTLNTFTCDHPFVGIKCLSGSQTFYLLGAMATGIT